MSVPCERCVRGLFKDANGAMWRCGFCGGTGLVAERPTGRLWEQSFEDVCPERREEDK